MGRGHTTYDLKYPGLEPWTSGRKHRDYSPTDAALQLAIAHVWLSEAETDAQPAKPSTAGFEQFRDFVLGYQDGAPKGPQWAAPLSGVPSYTIRALARHWTEARPGEAPVFENEEYLAQLVSQAERLHPDLSARTTAPSTGMPGRFIGGTVYDYEADEVIEGARVTLRLCVGTPGSGSTKDAELTVATDEFGNFLVDAPERGTYRLSIEKEGYIAKELGPVEIGDGSNLRDFAMFFDSNRLVW